MTAKVIYTAALRCEATHLRSGNEIITDAPVDNNGKGMAFSPTDLVATALANCMLTVMGILADRRDISIDGTTASLVKTMASDPRRIAQVDIVINFPQTYLEKDREILERTARNCPVARSLHSDIIQNIEFNYN